MAVQHQLRECVQLPDIAWAQVLQSLPQKDLLNARLVCKTFVRLDQLHRLQLTWDLEAKASASSLTLFVSRCLQTPSAPELEICVGWEWLENTHPWGLMLACTCSNLRCLSVTSELYQHDAEACLRLIPASITRLEMTAPEGLLSDLTWPRLRELRHLVLGLAREGDDPAPTGPVLASLSGLASLTLQYLEAPQRAPTMLDAITFAPSGITRLALGGDDPFHGQVPQECFPNLKEFSWLERHSLPKWVQSRHLQCLEVDTSLRFAQIDLGKVLCTNLRILSQSPQDICKLCDLLQLPALTCLDIQIQDGGMHMPPEPVVLLGGSHQEHRRFMSKVTTKLELPARLCLTGSPGISTTGQKDSLTSIVGLRSNGHAIVCLCNMCPVLP